MKKNEIEKVRENMDESAKTILRAVQILKPGVSTALRHLKEDFKKLGGFELEARGNMNTNDAKENLDTTIQNLEILRNLLPELPDNIKCFCDERIKKAEKEGQK